VGLGGLGLAHLASACYLLQLLVATSYPLVLSAETILCLWAFSHLRLQVILRLCQQALPASMAELPCLHGRYPPASGAELCSILRLPIILHPPSDGIAAPPFSAGMNRASKRWLKFKKHQGDKKRQKRSDRDRLIDKYGLILPFEPYCLVYESRHPAREKKRLPQHISSEKKARKNKAKKDMEDTRLPLNERAAVAAQELYKVHHTSSIRNVVVPNPNYEENMGIPRFAAIRMAGCVTKEQQEELLSRVKNVIVAGADFETTAAHGKSFRQMWVGSWAKYTSTPFLTAGRRQVNKQGVDLEISALCRAVDSVLSDTPWSHFSAIDPDTAHLMRFAHQPIARTTVGSYFDPGSTLRADYLCKGKKWLEEDPGRMNTSQFRLGNFGSMMAVSESTGNGTAFHYDEDDDGMLHVL
jgi:hypothetical protein